MVRLGEGLHVDGAFMNALPVDVMASFGAKRIIAVDFSYLPNSKPDFDDIPSSMTFLLDKFFNNGRRRYLVHRFKEMGLECFEPYGAFYVFPSIKKFGLTSEEFATRLLEEEKVAVVPGTAFGDCGEGFLRISYAYSLDDLKLALGRVRKFVERLEQKKTISLHD
jgi:predicted acylesterase/phospholipase RssA